MRLVWRVDSAIGFRGAWVLAVVLLISIRTPVLALAEEIAPKDPLVPRRLLFGNPDRALPKLSPDGTKLAFLAPVDGTLNIWVGPISDPAAARPVTHDKRRGIRLYHWAYTNAHLLYLQDRRGDENWHVLVADLETRKTRDLTPFDSIDRPRRGPRNRVLRPTARIQEVSPKFPEQILISLNKRVANLHDVYRVDLRSGALELVEKNTLGFIGYVTDADLAVRFGVRVTKSGGTEIMIADRGEWKSFAIISQEDALTSGPEGFDASGRVLYMRDSRRRNTAALVAFDLDRGTARVLAEDRQCDLDQLLIHPTGRTIQAVAFTFDRRRWQFLDASMEKDFGVLREARYGDIRIVSRSLDDLRWIVAYGRDDGPTQYHLYDRSTGAVRFLFVDRARLEQVRLAKMHPVVIKSRDGLDLVCYLTLPLGCETSGDHRPAKPVPMVLLVHGGPWHRDRWGFDARHQWLASRGYAVLSVNFRGSTGLGKNFLNAADKQWAAKMHDDLLDAVAWAIRERIAQPERIGIMGSGYGGYAALVGLTFSPETFACAVDIGGSSNLVTLLESIPPHWEALVELFTKRIGDHRTRDGRVFLASRSPLTFAQRIVRPLLIGEGANDPRIKRAESEKLIGAMRKNKFPVTYVLYPDESRLFARPENRLSFYAVAEAFLAEHLGGRVEPIGADFVDSSIDVPIGAGQVRGLKAALHSRK